MLLQHLKSTRIEHGMNMNVNMEDVLMDASSGGF
jgi:hypothetical protein